jgi:glycosyltransferase involved in cell wall biosynthesis
VARTDAPRIAVILPCYNEEQAIAQTIAGFRTALPQAEIYVYDNNSSDRTSEVAAAAGAIVRCEPLKGKGSVVRRMFADVDADFYVMADGDATYDPAAAPQMVARAMSESLDMVVGCRQTEEVAAYRSGHRFGNKLLTGILSYFFGRSFTDILSGYRVFSRRFVKSFPAFASGFEIETEISVHALRMRMPVGEVDTVYFARPEGSTSKLSTYRDGFIILSTIMNLVRLERPLFFFGVIGALLALVSMLLSIPIFVTYLQTGLVPRFPTVILIASIMLLAFLVAFTGLILDTVVRGRREALRMHYLSLPVVARAAQAAEPVARQVAEAGR